MISFVPEPHLLDSPRGRHWPTVPSPGLPGRAGEPPRTADVVVVGAGPAGLAVTSALWHHGVHDVVVLDATGRPCGRFFDRVDLLGQRVLRSPYEHHPGVEGFRDCELLDFARLHWAKLTPVERREVRMSQAGHRSVVPVDVFDAYCRHLAVAHHVGERLWRATVREVLPEPGGVTVRTTTGEVRAGFVLLCLGERRRDAPAAWWPQATGIPPSGVSYWDGPVPAGDGALVVVGAGLTAAHLVSNGLTGGRRVHWVVRGDGERYQCADVDSKFFRPEGRARFDHVAWEDRLRLTAMYRRASVMFEFRPGFERAESEGALVVHRGRGVTAAGPGTVRLGDEAVTGGHVVLALGTQPVTGAGLMPDAAVGLRDGWPDLVGATLAYRGAPRVFAVGAAAGMVLGPAARNIDGHRVATARAAATVARALHGGARVPRLPAAGRRLPSTSEALHA